MKKNYLAAYKVFLGLLGLSALVTEVVLLVERGIFNPSNFLSYFTVESNILAVIAFVGGALLLFAGKKSAKFDFFRGAVTFFMVVTGIVFALLLSGIEGVQLTAAPWDNIVLHYIIPLAIATDWLIDPPARRFAFRQAIAWIAFPVLYLIYSLARGPLVDWYPYPFINPANGGIGQVAVTSAIITAGGLILIYIITRVGARKTAKKK